ncbi:hypothetical protein KBD20_03400 [Candidatus Saccharibacteria bacterium]|nr:hypothetical protein [Candidatus Saccharibacteria bacterium]
MAYKTEVITVLRKVLNVILGKQITDSIYGGLPQFNGTHHYSRIERDYIAKEAEVGAWVLGDIPAGHTRKFFCLDTHTWVWHEQWTDQEGNVRTSHVQYDIRTDGILKRVNGGSSSKLSGQELINFDLAVTRYYHEVSSRVYGRTVATA